MHIIACINYQDQGVFILDEDKQVWRVWIDPVDRLPLFERSTGRDIPEAVKIHFNNYLK